MKILRFFSTLIVLASTLICVVQAQQGEGTATKTPSPTKATRTYLLGPGDVVEVKVFGQMELNSTARVDGDGNLSSLPFLEPIPARCRSEKELQKDITGAYKRLINDPQISVRVVEQNSRTPAFVFGAVRRDSKVPTLREVRLNELIAASGGFTEKAAGTIQILHTEPVMCPEAGEPTEAVPIDGTAIPFQVVKISDLQKGISNPKIRSGDLVLVTEAEPVYITGSVVSPGGVLVRDQLTLSRALAMVGGTRPEAKLSEIRIYRQKPGSTEQEILKVDYAAIKKNRIPDVFLKPYDVIDVSETGVFSGTAWWKVVVGALTGGLQNALLRPIP